MTFKARSDWAAEPGAELWRFRRKLTTRAPMRILVANASSMECWSLILMTGVLNFSIVYFKVMFSCSGGPALNSFPLFEMLMMRERQTDRETVQRHGRDIFLWLIIGR